CGRSSTPCVRSSCGTGSTSAAATRAASPARPSTGWATTSSSSPTARASSAGCGPGSWAGSRRAGGPDRAGCDLLDEVEHDPAERLGAHEGDEVGGPRHDLQAPVPAGGEEAPLLGAEVVPAAVDEPHGRVDGAQVGDR